MAPLEQPVPRVPPRADEHAGSNGSRWAVDAALVALAGAGAAHLLDPVSALLATLWAAAVLVVVRSDLARYLIPDAASAAIAALGVAGCILPAWREGGLAAVGPAAGEALSGGAAAFGFFWLVAWAYRRRAGREGLGFGDVKLAGASGLWLTLPQQLAALEIACLAAIGAALVWSRGASRGTAIPFGAFLAPAAWIVFVCGRSILAMLGQAV